MYFDDENGRGHFDAAEDSDECDDDEQDNFRRILPYHAGKENHAETEDEGD